MKTMNSIALSILVLMFFITKPSLQQQHDIDPSPPPQQRSNPRLFDAFYALQAWKNKITGDPKNLTSNWCGPNVCSYTGVYCAPAPDNPHITTVAGIDLNGGTISGSLTEELGLLTDLAVLHLNSNQFKGSLPASFRNLRLLYELDISNNLFSGEFPSAVLRLPSLKYLDMRYNNLCGKVPSELFDMKFDAVLINNNNFGLGLPQNIGNSTVSVLMASNNNLGGSLPRGIGRMAKDINEIALANTGLIGCLSDELGDLNELTVFDVSGNGLVGSLPENMGSMESLEEVNIAGNKLSGEIPASVCSLQKLAKFNYGDNYFCGEPGSCLKVKEKDDSKNCITSRPKQRSPRECHLKSQPVGCSN
ncbi:hypothetical protein ABFS83_07G035200 [Erythranthe nasuta]